MTSPNLSWYKGYRLSPGLAFLIYDMLTPPLRSEGRLRELVREDESGGEQSAA